MNIGQRKNAAGFVVCRTGEHSRGIAAVVSDIERRSLPAAQPQICQDDVWLSYSTTRSAKVPGMATAIRPFKKLLILLEGSISLEEQRGQGSKSVFAEGELHHR